MSVLLFWIVTPSGLAGGNQRFGDIYCLHHRGLNVESYFSPEGRGSQNYLRISLPPHSVISLISPVYKYQQLK
jgi:hypothetical protein